MTSPAPSIRLPPVSHRSRQGLWAAIAGAFAFSLPPILIRGNSFGPLPLMFWRLAGVAVLTVITVYLTKRRLTAQIFKLSLPTALIYLINGSAFFTALKTTSIVNVTVIGATAPIFLLWAAHYVFKETVTRRIVAATIIAIIGAILVFATPTSGTATLTGNLLAIVSTLTFAWHMTASRIALQQLEPLEFLAAWSTIAAVLTLPLVTLADGGLDGLFVSDTKSWLVAGGVITVGATAHLFTNYSHRRVRLQTISLLGLGSGATAIIWAWLIFDERLTIWQWFGTPLVAAAVYITIRQESTQQKPLRYNEHSEKLILSKRTGHN